jgi:hypothetical protein
MTKVYLLKYAFSTGIHTFEVPEKDIEGDPVSVTSRWWIRGQNEFYERAEIALSEEEALEKLKTKVESDLVRERKRHVRAMNKLEGLKLKMSNGTLPKITEH